MRSVKLQPGSFPNVPSDQVPATHLFWDRTWRKAEISKKLYFSIYHLHPQLQFSTSGCNFTDRAAISHRRAFSPHPMSHLSASAQQLFPSSFFPSPCTPTARVAMLIYVASWACLSISEPLWLHLDTSGLIFFYLALPGPI